MKLYIAGGCNEHGRNCFYVENATETDAIAVDCGISGGAANMPQLSDEQIKKIRFLFITHSHMDHVGALPWMVEHGFAGKVILTGETYRQMKCKPVDMLILNNTDIRKTIPVSDNLSFICGRSGHCRGAVWYKILFAGCTMLFSGDYCEHSETYRCDFIRKQTADFAMLDCAYGNDDMKSQESGAQFVEEILDIWKEGKSIILPCPKHGRGLDFVQLLLQDSRAEIYLEEEIYNQYIAPDIFWDRFCNQIDERVKIFEGKFQKTQAIYIISDPQVSALKTKKLIQEALKRQFCCIFTGHVDGGTEAENMIKDGCAFQYRYYVHQNLEDVQTLIGHNSFKKVAVNHCEHKIDEPSIIHGKVGTTIDIVGL